MTAEKTISYTCAVLLIASSIALAFIQVLDIDNIASGTLMYIAQAFLLAGSIFGLDYYLFKMTNAIKRSGGSFTKTTKLVTLLLMMAPAITNAQVITLHNTTYTSTYDLALQCPRQVEWTLRKTDIGNAVRVPGWKFINDIHHDLAVAKHDDYRFSGYDRGHLCPASDRSCNISSMISTFTMSNIAPQLPALNRGAWKSTEDDCRKLALQYDSVCVVAIPLFLNRDTMFIGQHRLAVPHAFIKACWLPGRDSVLFIKMLFNENR